MFVSVRELENPQGSNSDSVGLHQGMGRAFVTGTTKRKRHSTDQNQPIKLESAPASTAIERERSPGKSGSRNPPNTKYVISNLPFRQHFFQNSGIARLIGIYGRKADRFRVSGAGFRVPWAGSEPGMVNDRKDKKDPILVISSSKKPCNSSWLHLGPFRHFRPFSCWSR